MTSTSVIPKRARRGLVAYGLALCLVALVPGAASAHDHEPPPTTLFTRGAAQAGVIQETGWVYPDPETPDYCIQAFLYYVGGYPDPLPYQPGDDVVVRLRDASMPAQVQVRHWSRLWRDGYPRGQATIVPTELRPRVVNGRTRSWEVVFTPPIALGHSYLQVEAYWPDLQGCEMEGGASQFGVWNFHVAVPRGRAR